MVTLQVPLAAVVMWIPPRSARMCNINCNPQQLGFLDYHIMVVVVMVYTASDYSMSVMHHQLISVMLRQHMNNVMRLF